MNQNSHRLCVPTEIPVWLTVMNPTRAGASAKDVAALFGFSGVNSLHKAVSMGGFPAADFFVKGSVRESGRCTTSFMWRKSTIINEIKRRQQAKQGNP